MAKRKPSKQAHEPLPALVLQPAATRAEALLQERGRLLRDINRKKSQLEQSKTAAEREREDAMSKMAPLVERHDALIEELTALFAELLEEGRLSGRARNQVRQVRRSLELQGLLTPLADDQEVTNESARTTGEARDDPEPESPRKRKRTAGSAGGGSQKEGSPAGSQRDLASAPQLSQERRSLRDLFRSLARAIHPDHAREEADRVHRTEIMKQVTGAYEQGDFARLLELENAWQGEHTLAGEGDPEQRCTELERINRELLNQVKQLARELRDMRREASEAPFGAIEDVVEQASIELEELASLCTFVRDFRDGKRTLTDFVQGPLHVREEDIEAELERFFSRDLGFDRAPEGRRKKRSRQRY
jgi:hypothetical protein